MSRAGETIEEWTHDDETESITSSHITTPSHTRTWKTLIHTHLPITQNFTLSDVYKKCVEVCGEQYPNNDNPKAQIRHNLQRLRDDNVIVFINNNGDYKWK